MDGLAASPVVPRLYSLNQTTGHWYSMKLCENTQAVRSECSRASGAVEEQARRGVGSLRLRGATLRPNGQGSTASEEVYESSVVRFRQMGDSSSSTVPGQEARHDPDDPAAGGSNAFAG